MNGGEREVLLDLHKEIDTTNTLYDKFAEALRKKVEEVNKRKEENYEHHRIYSIHENG